MEHQWSGLTLWRAVLRAARTPGLGRAHKERCAVPAPSSAMAAESQPDEDPSHTWRSADARHNSYTSGSENKKLVELMKTSTQPIVSVSSRSTNLLFLKTGNVPSLVKGPINASERCYHCVWNYKKEVWISLLSLTRMAKRESLIKRSRIAELYFLLSLMKKIFIETQFLGSQQFSVCIFSALFHITVLFN